MPAAASTSEPVQTDVVHFECACASRSQPMHLVVLEEGARAVAARDHDDVRVGEVRERSVRGDAERALLGADLGPARSATNVTSAPGSRPSTS